MCSTVVSEIIHRWNGLEQVPNKELKLPVLANVHRQLCLFLSPFVFDI